MPTNRRHRRLSLPRGRAEVVGRRVRPIPIWVHRHLACGIAAVRPPTLLAEEAAAVAVEIVVAEEEDFPTAVRSVMDWIQLLLHFPNRPALLGPAWAPRLLRWAARAWAINTLTWPAPCIRAIRPRPPPQPQPVTWRAARADSVEVGFVAAHPIRARTTSSARPRSTWLRPRWKSPTSTRTATTCIRYEHKHPLRAYVQHMWHWTSTICGDLFGDLSADAESLFFAALFQEGRDLFCFVADELELINA